MREREKDSAQGTKYLYAHSITGNHNKNNAVEKNNKIDKEEKF